ncbi:TOPRIM domain containing protein [Burkholderiaceae bacterium]
MKNALIQTKDQSAVRGLNFNTRATSRSIDWQAYSCGEHRISCPSCGRSDRDKTLGLSIKTDTSVAHCFRCSFVESYRPERGAVMRTPTIIPQRKTQQKHEVLSQWGRDLWAECQVLDGVALAYLHRRQCVIPPKDSDLKWHPALRHPSGYIGAGLVGLVSDATTREPLSLHRTWISATGKADVSPPRMPLANHSLKNGCIRLWSDEFVNAGLGVAEGIESALCLAWAMQPVWALLDAGHLSKFQVIPSVECLTIAQDQDAAGRKAAHECAARWHKAGREVRITNQQTNDVNDLLEVAA